MVSTRPGKSLADRHRNQVFDQERFDPVHSILNCAERPQPNDWTLRSALVRLAQPHPELVSALLATSRRLDAAIKPVRSKLFKHLGPADRELTIGSLASEPAAPYCDVRIADLGRLCASVAGDSPTQIAEAAEALTADYAPPGSDALTELELKTLPLVAVASSMERLSVTLTNWADCGPDEIPPTPPVDVVEFTGRWGANVLDCLGIEAQ